MARRLTKLTINEGSLVDVPANPLATVALFKRGPECASGDADEDEEKRGDKKSRRGEDGMKKNAVEKDEAAGTPEAQPETKPEQPEVKAEEPTTKAADEAIAKRMADLEKRAADAEKRAADAENIAKAERETRINAEWVKKAEEYVVLGKADEAGPMLRKIADALGDDFAKFAEKIRAIQAQLEKSELFREIGKSGAESNADSATERVDKLAGELVEKKQAANYVEALRKLGDMPEHRDLMRSYLRESRGAH